MPVNKAGQHITPDRLAIATGSVALLGEFLMPLELLPACSLDSPVLWVGVVPMLCGLILEIAAVREMRRTGTATRPHGNRPTWLRQAGPVESKSILYWRAAHSCRLDAYAQPRLDGAGYTYAVA